MNTGRSGCANDDAEAGAGVVAYVGIGANLGDRAANVAQALRELGALPTIKVMRVSSLYETAPVGRTDQPDFLNAVAAVRTTLAPRDLLDRLLHVENQMGRVRNLRWGPRVIDLDLLLYGDSQVETPGLTLPHPRLRGRAFVLVPLAEIAPNLLLPEDGRRVSSLAENSQKKFGREGNIRRLAVV